MNKVVICTPGAEPAVRFAARELSRYLKLATGKTIPIVRRMPETAGSTFFVGVCEDVAVPRPTDLRSDDDWICIEPRGAGYVIAGSNPRSALFAVYRYLKALGFRWIRPGYRGEIVPTVKNLLKKSLRVNERASYRYRTICIEGACSREHARDLIDWAAKQAMNGYFIQFEYGLYFWARWYQHEHNPYRKAEPIDLARAQSIVKDIIGEIQKRGLRFERVGHGWTCAALGLEGEGWGTFNESDLTPEQRQWLAQMDGKRRLFHGVPINSNLCYGNPDVRRALNDKIVQYAGAHPEVDALHFWLADGSNNNCECDLCKDHRPADLFVDMLNELDAKLTAAGIHTKIVFLIYVDLLWPPVRSRLERPGRFILMFAPITRSYLSSFADAAKEKATMKDYVRNRLEFPKGAAENLAYLSAWQHGFRGDGFDFDYHIIWACYFDLSHFTLAKVLHHDIRDLQRIALDGLNSCQNQRASYPHNLLMDVMTVTLWDRNVSFSEIASRSFEDAFGKSGPAVAAFFEKVSALWRPFFEPVFAGGRDDARIRKGLANLPKIRALADGMAPTVRSALKKTTGAVLWSWKYLDSYLKLLDHLLPAFEAYLQCSAEVRPKFEAVFDFLWKQEKTVHPALDVDTLVKVFQWRINEVETERKAAETADQSGAL